jgi:hypothetical protein
LRDQFGSGAAPTTPGAVDTNAGDCEVFVLRLNPAKMGANDLLFGTYLGGADTDEGHAIALDAAGTVFVTGNTGSADFPTTPDALYPDHSGGGQYNYDGFLFQMESR